MTRLRPGCRDREDIGGAPILVRANLERALAARRCVDELGARPFQRRRRAAARMLHPDPAPPIERPLTVEEVLEELRVRLTLLRCEHRRTARSLEPVARPQSGLECRLSSPVRLLQRTKSSSRAAS